MSTQPERIAVFGGGVGAMTAVYWLTTVPGWQQRYRIDVYQMGWRLGGKGASGRSATVAERIEEHGLHIWFGFYDNAFATMQRVYAELGRPRGSPLATWDEAFKPHDYVCLSERVDDAWRVWPVMMPQRPGTPGTTPIEDEHIDKVLATLCEYLDDWWHGLDAHWHEQTGQTLSASVGATSPYAAGLAPLDASRVLRDTAWQRAVLTDAEAAVDDELTRLLAHLQILLHDAPQLLEPPTEWPDDLRRLYLCIDLGLAIALGMLADEVLEQGFEVINDSEFRTWLARYGALPATVDSAPVRGFYNLVFAYRDGNPRQPDIEAGTMLRGMLKVGFGYRGSIMYKMQAGMGDAVFVPLYELLRRRGVRFHFFHKLLALKPDTAGERVERIVLEQQVALAGSGYDPLVEVKGLPCWPSAPCYGQLDAAQAALLRQHGVNLESRWTEWPAIYRQAFGRELPRTTLRCGVDFDRIVFGLSVASLTDVASDLLPHSAALAQCSDKLRTVATQAYQVWTHEDLACMGWQWPAADGEGPVLSGFTEPFDTWASMDQLLCRENWSGDEQPRNVSYFCNVFAQAAYPPPADQGFPARCAARVKAAAITHLEQDIGVLWTSAGSDDFPWAWLVDPDGRSGVARFDAQYWRANVDPSERYVQSVVATSQFRLRADASGFDNLLLAGDWLKTGLDAGCVEAAVMGGMQASRVLCGVPPNIAGENGW